MAGYKSQKTLAAEARLAQARTDLEQEGRRSPDGSATYTRLAEEAQTAHEALHTCFADDRETARLRLRQTGPHIIRPPAGLPTFWAGVFILGTVWGVVGAPIYGWPYAIGAGLSGAILLAPHIRHRYNS